MYVRGYYVDACVSYGRAMSDTLGSLQLYKAHIVE